MARSSLAGLQGELLNTWRRRQDGEEEKEKEKATAKAME